MERREAGPASDVSPKISCYILAFNEREKIVDAVQSVLWCDEIIVADSGSTDGTAEAAAALGARVVQIPFRGFGPLRNEAISHCTGDWILSIDSDERCTPEARDALLRVAADPRSADIWRVPRRNWFMGRWIRHSGWYPNFRQPQFFRRGRMRYDLLPVHEGWIPEPGASVSTLPADIWQIPFKDLEQVMAKANRYSSLGAQKLQARGLRPGGARTLLHALHAFVKHYVFKGGILDGWPGFIIALGNFEGTFWRYAKCRELQERSTAPSPGRVLKP